MECSYILSNNPCVLYKYHGGNVSYHMPPFQFMASSDLGSRFSSLLRCLTFRLLDEFSDDCRYILGFDSSWYDKFVLRMLLGHVLRHSLPVHKKNILPVICTPFPPWQQLSTFFWTREGLPCDVGWCIFWHDLDHPSTKLLPASKPLDPSRWSYGPARCWSDSSRTVESMMETIREVS